MNIRQQYAIISAELAVLFPVTNRERTADLAAILKAEKFDATPCAGVYQGDTENGFFVTVNTPAQLERLKSIAFWQYMQESILYSDSAGKISLIFARGDSEALPDMMRVQSTEGLRNYTVISEQIITTEGGEL